MASRRGAPGRMLCLAAASLFCATPASATPAAFVEPAGADAADDQPAAEGCQFRPGSARHERDQGDAGVFLLQAKHSIERGHFSDFEEPDEPQGEGVDAQPAPGATAQGPSPVAAQSVDATQPATLLGEDAAAGTHTWGGPGLQGHASSEGSAASIGPQRLTRHAGDSAEEVPSLAYEEEAQHSTGSPENDTEPIGKADEHSAGAAAVTQALGEDAVHGHLLRKSEDDLAGVGLTTEHSDNPAEKAPSLTKEALLRVAGGHHEKHRHPAREDQESAVFAKLERYFSKDGAIMIMEEAEKASQADESADPMWLIWGVIMSICIICCMCGMLSNSV